jgi:hypothetical protein
MKFNNTSFIRNQVFFLLLLTFSNLFAQTNTGTFFLLISPSPAANSMGQTYGTVSDFDPMAAVFNPAALGFFVQKNYFGYTYNPQKIQWLSTLTNNMSYSSSVTCIGLSLQKWIHFPVYFGIAYHAIKLDFGRKNKSNPESKGTYSRWDEVKGTTLSISFDHYIRGSIGFTFKHIESHRIPSETNIGGTPKEAKVNASDFGILLEVPVFDLLKINIIKDCNNFNFVPFFNPGLYYSLTNMGDKFKYTNTSHTASLSRNLTLGFNIKTGIQLKKEEKILNLFSYKWAREVSDILVETDEEDNQYYVSGLHDINIGNHLILGKIDESIISKNGHEFSLLDIYFEREGEYTDLDGNVVYESFGWGIDFLQPVKILTAYIAFDNTIFNKIIANLHFEVHHSQMNIQTGHPLSNTSFKSYIIRLNNFTF